MNHSLLFLVAGFALLPGIVFAQVETVDKKVIAGRTVELQLDDGVSFSILVNGKQAWKIDQPVFSSFAGVYKLNGATVALISFSPGTICPSQFVGLIFSSGMQVTKPFGTCLTPKITNSASAVVVTSPEYAGDREKMLDQTPASTENFEIAKITKDGLVVTRKSSP
ncbi:hypothetical protein [Acidocella facilis]|uniref:hypothetical protein n=1 Tax=Acidocella facilis TaxID=525 RepID=UPI0012DFE8CB|nr:hypothetical protein [Acidocella facilis]